MSAHFENEKTSVGNAAAMREALKKLDKWLYIGVDGRVHGLHDKTEEIERTIKAAISTPPRNCDVGTAEEQAKRFDEFCNSRTSCAKCTVHDQWDHFFNDCGLKRVSCGLIFAQMPYLNE